MGGIGDTAFVAAAIATIAAAYVNAAVLEQGNCSSIHPSWTWFKHTSVVDLSPGTFAVTDSASRCEW